MDMNNITDLAGLTKIHFTLEELKEMNRDMESIMRLMDSLKDAELPPEREQRPVSNIYVLRPDKVSSGKNTVQADKYFKIPRILE